MTSQDLSGAVILLAYFIAFAAAIGLLTRLVDLPRELTRKSYHIFCSLSVFVLLLCFDNWYAAVLAISVLLGCGFMLLLLSDHIPFAAVAIDRGGGMSEIREHLLFLLISTVLLLTLFWGVAGAQHRYAVAAGLLAWGFGDAAASIAGTRFARRRFRLPVFDPHKSPLGTWVMVACSFLVCLPVLLLMAPLSLSAALPAALLLALLAGAVEAATRRGLDTLTVPLAVGGAAWAVVTATLSGAGA